MAGRREYYEGLAARQRMRWLEVVRENLSRGPALSTKWHITCTAKIQNSLRVRTV